MVGDARDLQVIADRARQLVAQGSRLNETDTKAVLVEPFLRWLGWDTYNPNEVMREWRRRGKDEPVDYALMADTRQVLLLEAKALRDSLGADRGWKQIVTNGFTANFRWCARTNGRRVVLLNLLHDAPLEDKVFFDIDLSTIGEPGGVSLNEALEKLGLMSKVALVTRRTDEAWEAHHSLAAAQAAVVAFFSAPPPALLALIRDTAGDASLSTDLLTQCVVQYLGRPVSQDATSTADNAVEAQAPRGRATVSDLLSAGLVRPGDEWRGRYKGQPVAVTVTANGGLDLAGTEYRSPSLAGNAATGWTACDGWKFWRYLDANGAWSRIAGLREQLLGGPVTATASRGLPPEGTDRGSAESLIASQPHTRPLFEALLERARLVLGAFEVTANSRHIVFRNRSAFAAIRVQSKGLRIGLRLNSEVARDHPRLAAQPKGIFEGWAALHVSTVVREAADVDDELIALMQRAHAAAV